MNYRTLCSTGLALVLTQIMGPIAAADELPEGTLQARIEKLEADNARLQAAVESLMADIQLERIPATAPAPTAAGAAVPSNSYVGVAPAYGYAVLDHAETVNKKRILQLQARQDGTLSSMVTLSGQATVLADYQTSNRDDKFGYLMRNPTSANQIGDTVSEAVVHSASLAATAALTDDITAYIEMFYSPEQSFGAGTITALTRNQVQVRRAYLMWGNLDKSPVYAAIGKMDTPFGLNDTVSPFTNSTVWHSFAGLAYGAEVGYLKDGLSLRAMAIQGGAQFRAANTPVEGTNVPSKLNNFAVDANYTLAMGEGDGAMFGASYQHGSPYCQGYPVFHFNPCEDNNPAWSGYGKLEKGPFTLLAEYAQTTDVWPGSAVPDPSNPLSVFDAQKTKSWVVGTKYGFGEKMENDTPKSAVSFEFSTFVAGDTGSPWERQNQWVLGYSKYLAPNVNLFSEYVHVDGFAPLNFVSGGNFPDGTTWSDKDARTDLFLIGAQAAF
jgi:hypothetical protein